MSYMTGKDLLLLPNGATYHLGVKVGELAPRVIVVGAKKRAEEMSKLLDKIDTVVASDRLMFTYTGTYKGVRVSIVAIGMGAPMMDFFVRESSFVCPGPMAVIRIGTCGLFNPSLPPGTIVVAGKGSTLTYINQAGFTDGLIDGTKTSPSQLYYVTKPVLPDQALSDRLLAEMKKLDLNAVNGLNNASDTFFATQGRQDSHFYNGDNKNILEEFATHGVDSCEMEAFTLFQLARQRTVAPLKAAAAHIGILSRVNPAMTENISTDQLHENERLSGKAALEALIATEL
jgi:uridine phosphorylase